MRKLLKSAIAAAVSAAIMTSCGASTYECSLCGDTFEGKGNKVKRDGVTATFCDDCYELYQLSASFMDALDSEE